MLVAWGDAAEIQRQVDQYFDAGATQVVLMPGSPSMGDGGITEQLAPNSH
jgi:hypothetical protein